MGNRSRVATTEPDLLAVSGSAEHVHPDHSTSNVSSLLERVAAALSGRYAIQRELGRGGMAYVFLAEDLKHGRLVAIKVLRPELAAALGVARFLREIEISARLRHPEILPLFDSGDADGIPYFVMPYIAGASLRERLNREAQLPVGDALAIATQVADALTYAHEQGVVHRDIKPENILLDHGHALVADFGVAQAISEAGGEKLTATGIALGTPVYMSPEQSAGRVVDGRSDLYSLGCVVYEMLGGEPPFTGASGQAVLARHLSEPPPALRIVRPAVPVHVARAIDLALAKVPADRFATVKQFANALTNPAIGARAAARRWVRTGRRVVGLAAAVAVLGILLWRIIAGRPPDLNAREVVVFPFAVTGAAPTDSQLGQSVALALSWALNTTSGIRALDGWQLLDAARRDAREAVDWPVARAIATERKAGRLITGSVLVGDSVRMMLDLFDVASGAHLHRTLAVDPVGDPWTLGLQGAGDLIRIVTGGDTPADYSVLIGHSPAALEHFLQGEQAYRRARFDAAFDHYRSALRADSAFALAALRAAQAARWSHRDRLDAAILAGLSAGGSLPPRYAAFARGLQAYVGAEADSAVAAFTRVIALEPDWHEAWMALGEVYTHLLPDGAAPDSAAAAAFGEVRRLDPDFIPVLYHSVQVALRAGELHQAEGFLGALRRAGADTLLTEPTELLVRCAADGPSGIDWDRLVAQRAASVSEAAQWFTAGGLPFPECAETAWRALLRYDTTGTFTFAGLLGLQSVLQARGRFDALRTLLEADTLFDPGLLGDLTILAATTGAPIADRAAPWADSLRALAAADSTFNPVRLWFLGIWELFRGDTAAAKGIVDRLDASALEDSAPTEGVRIRRLLAHSLAARLALARGDSADAMERLRALRPTGSGQSLRWYPWESVGGERLLLAELLLATGAAAEALRIASQLDAPGPVPYVMYLPASLAIRERAARLLGYVRSADHLSERRAALLQ